MNADEIKQALADRAEDFARWLFPAGRKNGNEWLVGSLNGEAGKSLSICIKGPKAGVFADFATSESGDNLLELYAQAKCVDFKEALHACAEWLGQPLTHNSAPAKPRPIAPPNGASLIPGDIYSPSDDECLQAVQMLEALSSDAASCERIAKARHWKTETIRQLALEGYLGWHEGKLAFVYDTGVKRRWREKGERVIRWLFGKPWIWRGAWLNNSRTVYLCESETDAISLIDGGVETEAGVVVVAMPSASTFKPEWAELFRGKDVILAFDNDEAGAKATQRVSGILRGHVHSLNRLDWEGVQHAAQG